MGQALTEVEAAAAAGFKLWRQFQRARTAKMFPDPVRILPGLGPVWTQQQIDAWLMIVEPADPKGRDDEEEALRRARQGKTSLRRAAAVGQR